MHIQNIYDHNSFQFTKNEIPKSVIIRGELNPNSQKNICPLQHKLLKPHAPKPHANYSIQKPNSLQSYIQLL